MDEDVPAEVHHVPPELRFDLAGAVVPVGSTCTAEIKHPEVVLLSPTEGVPDEEFVGRKGREPPVRGGIPVDHPALAQKDESDRNELVVEARREDPEHPTRTEHQQSCPEEAGSSERNAGTTINVLNQLVHLVKFGCVRELLD